MKKGMNVVSKVWSFAEDWYVDFKAEVNKVENSSWDRVYWLDIRLNGQVVITQSFQYLELAKNFAYWFRQGAEKVAKIYKDKEYEEVW